MLNHGLILATSEVFSKTKKTRHESESLESAPDMIRTCDLLIRNQTLYPAELRVHFEGDNYNSTNLLWQEFI